MNINQRIQSLKKVFNGPLPGIDAQSVLSPVDDRHYRTPLDDHRKASVMALFHMINNQEHLIFIQRTSHNPHDQHAGQISFPGGKIETEDNSFLDAALREVEEEIGVPEEAIEVIGELTDLYVYVSNFVVYPFVGYLKEEVVFKKQESEVADIITYPVRELLKENALRKGEISVRNGTLKDVPYYDLNGNRLWGATAMITNELLLALRNNLASY